MRNTDFINKGRRSICFSLIPGPGRNRGSYFLLPGDYENAMGVVKDKNNERRFYA